MLKVNGKNIYKNYIYKFELRGGGEIFFFEIKKSISNILFINWKIKIFFLKFEKFLKIAKVIKKMRIKFF